jgi:hypothetical protein
MKHLFVCFALAAVGCAAYAGDDAAQTEEKSSVEQFVRQDSLEIPGLTAGCHVCEWRPKLNQKPAAEQCGVDAEGKPLLGLFECGYSEDCERVCNFLACGDKS